MPNILVCTDGSAYASSVYDHAAWAAQRLGASIHVLHLVDPHHETVSSADLTGAIGLGAKSALMEELVQLEATKAKLAHAKGRVILEAAREHLAKAGIANVLADQKHGSLADSIEAYDAEADLVVIGKRGENTSLDYKHLGSNLERVVRTCTHPVLVAARVFKPVKRVLLAYDAGPGSERAVDYIATQALLKGCSIHLLSVGSGDARISGGMTAAKTKLETAGYAVTSDIQAGHPIEVIGAQVKTDGIDLLVMGAYGHMKIRHLLIGSTTATLLRTCAIPALLFR
ncbi:universal stress protein [Congregicoccus parvus]|uniref:universal stress protein n=1 Tax=Congregicoccus parvus TaxID=3081749 RepID=UPI003FA55379